MIRDDKIESIRLWLQTPMATSFGTISDDLRFLLAELDAATVRAAELHSRCCDLASDAQHWKTQANDQLGADAQRQISAALMARVQRLTDALERTPCDICAHSDCRAQSPAIIKKMGLCPRCAALAEGEDTRD